MTITMTMACCCLINRNKGGRRLPGRPPGVAWESACGHFFVLKILRRFGMDVHEFWLPFRLIFMISSCFQHTFFEHRFCMDFLRIFKGFLAPPDHVKRRF